ncbi:MAG: hypothetical protein R3F59_00635 [Myxococcota bacterium]
MSLADDNAQVLRLVQALVGAVSPNFRRVALEPTAAGVRLWFLLARDEPDDRDEIDEVAFAFEALQEGPVEVAVEIVCDDRPLEALTLPGRPVYGRREGA